ncbi:MAG: efflux RND transporter periplasmic adaptor subunit [Ferruginibacter sp.]|nr:efflux RND transporter periplasmic adaptor subunit [Cytophagales bacterium]
MDKSVGVHPVCARLVRRAGDFRKGWGWFSLLTSLLLVACDEKPAETEEDASTPPASVRFVRLTAAQHQNAGLQLGKVASRRLSRVITVNGVLDVPPQNIVSVSAPLGGFLKTTRLLPGTRVKKGQVIALMEHPDYVQLQQDYLDGKSRLTFATLEYERQKELNREDVNSAKVFQQATADYEVLQNRVNALAEKLALIGLRPEGLTSGQISRTVPLLAPISGYVKEVNVNIGQYVNPPDVLFEIVSTDHMHLALSVFEKDAPAVRAGQRVRFTLPNDPGRERLGDVHIVGKVVGDDRTVPIHVHLHQDDPAFLLGMYVSARIEVGDSTAPALPDAAVVQAEGKDYIFVLGDGPQRQYERVEVRRGRSENGYTAVQLPARLDADRARVVVKGAYTLLAKMLNVEEAE